MLCEVVSKASQFCFVHLFPWKCSSGVCLTRCCIVSVIGLFLNAQTLLDASLPFLLNVGHMTDAWFMAIHSVLSFQPGFLVQILLWHVAIDMDPVFPYWVKGDYVTNTSCAFPTRDALTSEFSKSFYRKCLARKAKSNSSPEYKEANSLHYFPLTQNVADQPRPLLSDVCICSCALQLQCQKIRM